MVRRERNFFVVEKSRSGEEEKTSSVDSFKYPQRAKARSFKFGDTRYDTNSGEKAQSIWPFESKESVTAQLSNTDESSPNFYSTQRSQFSIKSLDTHIQQPLNSLIHKSPGKGEILATSVDRVRLKKKVFKDGFQPVSDKSSVHFTPGLLGVEANTP